MVRDMAGAFRWAECVCLTLRPPPARRLGAGPGLCLRAGPEANRLQRCHDQVVRPSRRREALAIGLAAVTLLCVVAIVVLDSLVRDVGRADLAQLDALGTIPYMVTIATSTATGALVALRRPAHPVGWLFLAWVSASRSVACSTATAGTARSRALAASRRRTWPRCSAVASSSRGSCWSP